jgi:hypothetical protein
MLALHVDAAFSAGFSKKGQCGLHPSAESRTPDGARLVGAVQSAFELPTESCRQGKTWWWTAEELLVRRQNAVEKSSFDVEMVYVQVEFVSDGEQSANSGRLRHW